MAATAGDSATSAAAGDSATSAAAAAAVPAPGPSIPAQGIHKSRLQEFCQRSHKKLPIYSIETEGEYHLPKFKCTVEVDGQKFSSTQSFSRRKEAEYDAARVACEVLVTGDKGDVKEVFELIDQGLVFCKSILYEFAVKTKTSWPTYSIARQEKPMTLFVASVVFNGSTYTGEAATSKKEAEQKAAWAAVKSILASGNRCLMEIIRSKENLIRAIKSSRNSEDKGAVSQEVHKIATKALSTFTPIKFTRAACTEYGEQDHVAPESQDQSSVLMTVQEHNIVSAVDPSVNPSAIAVTPSRKRKGRGGGEGTFAGALTSYPSI